MEEKLSIDGNEVEWQKEAKYLGVIMDTGLTWKQHVKYAVDKTNKAMNRLYPIIGRRSRMDINTKLRIIKAVARPQLTYGSVAWGYAAKNHIKRIQSTEDKYLRWAIDAPWFVRNIQIHRDLKWDRITDFMKKKAERIFEKLIEHPNEELRRLIDYDPAEDARRMNTYRKRPRDQLRNDDLNI